MLRFDVADNSKRVSDRPRRLRGLSAAMTDTALTEAIERFGWLSFGNRPFHGKGHLPRPRARIGTAENICISNPPRSEKALREVDLAQAPMYDFGIGQVVVSGLNPAR